jgi:hypothetical protein
LYCTVTISPAGEQGAIEEADHAPFVVGRTLANGAGVTDAGHLPQLEWLARRACLQAVESDLAGEAPPGDQQQRCGRDSRDQLGERRAWRTPDSTRAAAQMTAQ